MRTRSLDRASLGSRIASLRFALGQPHGDGFAGYAECLAYDLDDALQKLERVRNGEEVIEVFDSALGRWQDQ